MQVIRWHTKKLACGVRNEYTPDTMKALGMNDPKWINPNAVWPDGLMTTALQNMTSEIFEEKASCVLASGMQPDQFSVVIQLKIGQTLSETELKSKLEYRCRPTRCIRPVRWRFTSASSAPSGRCRRRGSG